MIFRILAIVAIVVGAAVPSLPMPFTGDQALFALGGRSLAEGGVLYRDFWDIKQPGIFVFYAIGGSLFGFSEVGIHIFEMCWWIAFSITLCFALKRSFEYDQLPVWPAALTAGVYYGLAGSFQMTQVEALAGFPLFLCVWCASEASRGNRSTHWLIAAGFFGGVVLCFKLFFALILAAWWLHTLAMRARENGWWTATIQLFLATGFGLSLAVTPVLFWFDQHDLLPVVYQTFIVYPPRMLTASGLSGLGTLASGLHWFAQSFAPSLALAAIACYLPACRPGRDLSTKLVLWAAFGMIVVLLQRRSWWSYHYLLLLVPLGVLAGRGLGTLSAYFGDSPDRLKYRRIAPVVACLLFLPAFAGWGERFVLLGIHRGAITEHDRLAFSDHFSPNYNAVHDETAFLRSAETLPGPIFVLGDPLLYWHGKRGQAVAIHGWALEMYIPEIGEQLTRQLRLARPRYVFVHNGYRERLCSAAPDISDLLANRYTIWRSSGGGVWYVLRTDGITAP